jgi:hypothetical protein
LCRKVCVRAGGIAQWYTTWLACTRPWVWSPTLPKKRCVSKYVSCNTNNLNWSSKIVISGGLVLVGRRRQWGKSVTGWKWCKYCVHMYVHRQMRPVETIPGMGGGGG